MIPVLLALVLQTCPVTHPALTPLDHASMLAAFTASFQGLYGRAPTLQPGSGFDDGEYWIRASDHYGEFSDGVCRAGWSADWEQRIAGQASVNPALGDQPARFQPATPVPPPVIVPPAPPPVPPLPSVVTCDLSSLETAVANLRADLDAFELRSDQFYEDARGAYKRVFVWIGKYGAPIVAAIFAGRATK